MHCPIGRVVSELAIWVAACVGRSPNCLADAGDALIKILRACDEAAQILPGAAALDIDQIGWPGLVTKTNQYHINIIRK